MTGSPQFPPCEDSLPKGAIRLPSFTSSQPPFPSRSQWPKLFKQLSHTDTGIHEKYQSTEDKRTPSLHLMMSSQKCSHNPSWQIIHYQGTWGVTKTHTLQLLIRKHACLPSSSIAFFGQTNFIHQKRLLPVLLTNGQIRCNGTTPSI